MILLSLPFALIAIVFGARLLAQARKESLGGFIKFVSWFVMIAGFLLILHGIMHICHRACEERMMNKECRMMKGCNDGMGCSPMWMMYHQRGNMNCCNGMMNCMPGNSCNSMMNCTPNGSCNEGNMKGGSCPMMDSMKRADSTKAKK